VPPTEFQSMNLHGCRNIQICFRSDDKVEFVTARQLVPAVEQVFYDNAQAHPTYWEAINDHSHRHGARPYTNWPSLPGRSNVTETTSNH
jgi:hypothetical protein